MFIATRPTKIVLKLRKERHRRPTRCLEQAHRAWRSNWRSSRTLCKRGYRLAFLLPRVRPGKGLTTNHPLLSRSLAATSPTGTAHSSRVLRLFTFASSSPAGLRSSLTVCLALSSCARLNCLSDLAGVSE
jgi:hypothetical protein